ncbi:hypothetical protein SARC_14020, partial [Sphaeroforma arctica JP610]
MGCATGIITNDVEIPLYTWVIEKPATLAQRQDNHLNKTAHGKDTIAPPTKML